MDQQIGQWHSRSQVHRLDDPVVPARREQEIADALHRFDASAMRLFVAGAQFQFGCGVLLLLLQIPCHDVAATGSHDQNILLGSTSAVLLE